MADTETQSLESVVFVPAPGAGQVVHELRMEFDPSAAAGIPPHVTLMFPFIPPRALTPATIGALEKLISRAKAFNFTLARVNQFEQGVVYLEPDPAGPFIELTREIGREFGLQPFGGQFGEDPITHLTVAIEGSPSKRKQVADRLDVELPLALRAKEAWLMVGSNVGGWKMVRQMLLTG